MREPNRRQFLVCLSAAAIHTGDWAAHGLRTAQREELHSFVSAAAESRQIAGGSLAIVHRGEVIFRESFGYADIQTRERFGTTRINHLASVSKSMTSTVAVMLDERGALRLDDAVKKYLPAFADVQLNGRRAKNDVLVWHGLAHRTGLPGNSDLREDRRELMHLTAGEYLDRLLREGLLAEPGERFSYGAAGYMMVQAAIEKAVGKPFEQVARDLLFDPLGMARTTIRPSGEDLAENPTRYRREAGMLVEDQNFPPGFGSRKLINSGGGFFSTLDEMTRFVAFHLAGGEAEGKRLVAAGALARMRRPHPADAGEFIRYGLGLNLQPRRIGKARHTGASGAMIWLDAEGGWGGVLLTQTRWAGNQRFRQEFERKINSIFKG